MQVERGISLKECSTLKVGGAADFFVRAKNIEDMREALQFAKEKELPFFILGGGSNVLFADEGFRGVVIKNEIQHVEFSDTMVAVGSGAPLAAMVMETARRGLAGLEKFSGIPGTVGGAVVGNANEIGEKVTQVKTLNEAGEKTVLGRNDLEFSYRDSNLRDKTVLEVIFELETTDRNLSEEVAHLAREKVAKHPFDRTAGSWFKNPSSLTLIRTSPSSSCSTGLLRTSPDNRKAWELIEQAGCRSLRSGDAVISEQHANFFQNTGEATAQDFLELEKQVVEKVEERFGVRLEREVIVVSAK